MLKQSDNIHRFATKFGLLAGILLCVEAILTTTSIFGALFPSASNLSIELLLLFIIITIINSVEIILL